MLSLPLPPLEAPGKPFENVEPCCKQAVTAQPVLHCQPQPCGNCISQCTRTKIVMAHASHNSHLMLRPPEAEA